MTLAAIEVRFPDLARRIDGYFKERATNPGPTMSGEIRRLGTLKFLSVGAAATYALGLVFSLIFWLSLDITLLWALGAGLLAGTILAVSMFFIERGLESFMRLSSSWVVGRSVGTLGIIIAGFGVLGEAYQFTTQLVV